MEGDGKAIPTRRLARDILSDVKLTELARLSKSYQISRAATELCCVLFALIGNLEMCLGRDEHDLCLAHARVFAFGYRSDRGTYSISKAQRQAILMWSHRITTDPNFVDVILANFHPNDVTKKRLEIAKAILERGSTHRCDFETRIRSSLTKSHVRILRWCEEMVRRRSINTIRASPRIGFYPRPKSPLESERTSLAFKYIETRKRQNYVQTLADTTIGKERTQSKIREVYKECYPKKNVDEVIEHFSPNREVIALRKAQERFKLFDKPDALPELDFDSLKDSY